MDNNFIAEQLESILNTFEELNTLQKEALRHAIINEKGKVTKGFFEKNKIKISIWVSIIKLLADLFGIK